MEKQLAEYLAEETVRIFREICTLGKEITRGYYSSDLADKLDKVEIVAALSLEKMGETNFELPYIRSLKRKHLQERQVEEDFEARRILKNSPDRETERSAKLLKELNYRLRGKGFDSSVLSKYALDDPKIGPLMDKSFALGNPYSILVHWVRKEEIAPEHLDWVRRPILIIPGLTEKNDIRNLYLYSIRYQKPSKKELLEMK